MRLVHKAELTPDSLDRDAVLAEEHFRSLRVAREKVLGIALLKLGLEATAQMFAADIEVVGNETETHVLAVVFANLLPGLACVQVLRRPHAGARINEGRLTVCTIERG